MADDYMIEVWIQEVKEDFTTMLPHLTLEEIDAIIGEIVEARKDKLRRMEGM